MKFGLGLKRSAPHKLARRVSLAQHPAVRDLLASGALPDAADLHQWEPPILDQGPTGSCTAASTTAGVATAFAAAGQPLGFVPSQRELYAATRAFERALMVVPGQPLPGLTDSGCELADVYACLGTYGVKAMSEQVTSDGRYYDLEVAAVNDEPSLADLEAAGQKLVIGPYGVDPTSTGASDTLAAAIVARIPVGVACYVDTAFENLTASDVAQPANQNDPNGGGHALVLTGYRTVSGVRQWRVRNSWSIAWGDAGYIWASEAWRTAMWEAHPLAVVLEVQ